MPAAAKPKATVLLLLAIALAVGFLVQTHDFSNSTASLLQGTAQVPAPASHQASGGGVATPPPRQPGGEGPDIVGELPDTSGVPSLQGTRIHGDLKVDANGNLVIDRDVKVLFSYFLNALGEIPRDELLEKMRAGIAAYLPEPAQSQALALLENYVKYQDALQAEIDNGLYDNVDVTNLSSLEEVFRTRSYLREQYLGSEAAQAFFGEEEAYDNYTLAKLQLQANTDLSDEERRAHLQGLESQLPESQRHVLEKQRERTEVSDRVNELRAQGADIQELEQEWYAHYDNDTVERLVALEKRHQEWDRRYADYRQKRAAIMSPQLSPDAQYSELAKLQHGMFSDPEIRRVQALDRMHN